MSKEHVNSHTYSDPILKYFKEHLVRIVIDKEGEPWWLASDICEVLDLKTNDAVSILDDDEIRIDKFKHDVIDFEFNRVLVNRSGAYSIIIVSDYPDKKAFRKFITNQLVIGAESDSLKSPVPPLLKGGGGDLISAEPVHPVETQDFASLKPVVAIIGTRPITTSLAIATAFGKNHFDVLKAIKTLDTPEDFNARNFAAVDYRDAKGEMRPMYQITRDGFTFLAMGFTGPRATEFKLAYIDAFNKMEEALKKQAYAGIEQKLRTQLALPDPRNLIYKGIDLGKQLNALGMDMDGLAKLCRLRRAYATQADCAAIFGIGKEKIQAIERLLREIGISFSPVIANKQAKKDLDNLNSLFGVSGPGFPLNKGGQGVVNQEVTHV